MLKKTHSNRIWKNPHILQANSPGFEQVTSRLMVDVKLVPDPAKAHVKVKAIKTPTGAPRFRSTADTENATMDWRDPTEEDETTQTLKYFNIGSFDDGSDDPSALSAKMDEVVEYLKKEGAGGKHIQMKMTGRSTPSGSESFNQDLAKRRARNVQDYIFNHTPPNIMIGSTTEALGEIGTTDDPAFRRVDVEIIQEGKQNTAAHEAGHMFGLGDEYEDEGKGRFNGDKPNHYDDVKNELGEKAADDMITDSSDSIMAGGDVVEAGHYVPFIQAMEAATGIQWIIKQ
jgi:outer membrane protein OmpA-like peptidoglycan-associated protein